MRRETGHVRDYFGSFGVSFALHALLLAVLVVGIRLPMEGIGSEEEFSAIEAVVIDLRELERAEREKRLAEQRRLAAIEAEKKRKRDDARRREEERQAEMRRQQETRERQEALKREEAAKREAEIKRQQERKAEAERKRREQEAKQVAEAEARRLAEAEQKALEEKRRVEEEAKRVAAEEQAEEDRRREAMEAEAKRIEAERQAREAAERKRRLSGLEQQYIAAIQAAVMSKWNIPPSYQSGWQARVFVQQAPGGYILDVRIDRCTGDAAFCRSVEAAVRKAEPLPLPPDPEVFNRELDFTFDPQ